MSGGKQQPGWQKRTEKVLTSRYVLIALLLIPIFIAVFFRAYPTTLPATADWAEQSVRTSVAQQFETQIRQQYPHLPAQQVQARANQMYAQIAAENPEQIQEQIDALDTHFKSRLQRPLERSDGTEYQQTYFLDLDTYYYLRRAENVLETGSICDETRDDECIDNLMIAPNGVTTRPDLHSYVVAAAGSVGMFFGLHRTSGMFFLTPILAALMAIPAFFIVQRRWGSFAGFVSALIVVTHTVIMGRTPAGFADTDPWVVLFPLLISWLVLEALNTRGTRSYALIAGAAILTSMYASFWAGWYFAFTVLWLTLAGTAAFVLVKSLLPRFVPWVPKTRKTRDALHPAALLGIYLGVTGVILSIVTSPKAFLMSMLTPVLQATGLQDPVLANLWPNVLTTVAELSTMGLPQIVGQVGGRLLFVFAVFGIFSYALSSEKLGWKRWAAASAVVVYYAILTSPTALQLPTVTYLLLFALPLLATLLYALITTEELSVHYGIFLIGWFTAALFATTQGVRFLVLLIPILAISIGFATGFLLRFLPRIAESELELPAFYGKAVCILLIALVLFSPVGANMLGKAHSLGKGQVPSMNDAWWDALTEIKENSAEDAIITSWWDFGHWFKYVADRRVTFDGASQSGERAHLVGRMLSEERPEDALEILRMLNCGGHSAIRLLETRERDTLDVYHILEQLLDGDAQSAQTLLAARGYTDEEIARMQDHMYCTPPESFVVVSEDMVGKSGVWGHFGAWDFDRAYAAQVVGQGERAEAIENLSERLGLTAAEAGQMYSEIQSQATPQQLNAWVAPWPSLVGLRTCERSNQTITCPVRMQVGTQQGVAIVADSLSINMSMPQNATITAVAQGQIVGELQPQEVIIDGEAYAVGGEFLSASIRGNTAVIGDRRLVDGLFAQLFFLEDGGEYFETLIETQQITGGKIIVYRVDWDAYIADTTA